jgi:hypothetical protein
VISRWARGFLVVSAIFLVAALVATLLGASRRVEVIFGVQGFVLTTVFGKAYSLIPSYFDRTLVWPGALRVHLALTVLGVGSLGMAGANAGPGWLDAAGALLWCLGVAVFLVTILTTVRDNLTGSETATGGTETDRQRIDRFANAFVPVALGYLVAGSYELLAGRTGLPTLLDGTYSRVAHLLAAGLALLLLFAIGYRLLPRFLSVPTPGRLAVVVLPLGAVGPALVAGGLPAGPMLYAGAGALVIAVAGFAASYGLLVSRTENSRVGFYGPLAGVVLGLVGVILGGWFALDGVSGMLSRAHLRVNVFGLLGTTVVGVVYQFYPPAVGRWPGAGDRTALATIGMLAVGIGLSALGAVVSGAIETVGLTIATAGALGYLYLLTGSIRAQTTRR